MNAQDMQLRVEDANSLLIAERDMARKQVAALQATCAALREEAAQAIAREAHVAAKYITSLSHRATALEAWGKCVEAERRVVSAALGEKTR